MKNWLLIIGAFLVTVPAWLLRLGGILGLEGLHLSPLVEAALYGAGIVAAAFIVSWATEVAEQDISQALALAFVALIAVLPEYAVDAVLAWKAGVQAAAGIPFEQQTYVHFATANMTGANRLLIGLAWPLVVILWWVRTRQRGVALQRGQGLEVTVLTLATIYSFAIFIKASISLVDAVVLVTLFIFYIYLSSRGGAEEPELIGPAATIAALGVLPRRIIALCFFLFAAATILAVAEPFAEALLATGRKLNIEEFILIQWLAPLASEAPEIVVAAIFTIRGSAISGLGALISSKVNQWTLLVGTLPIVYSLSLGSVGALMLDSRQSHEFLLTSAQSLFAVILLIRLHLSVRGAAVLFVLFITQLFIPVPQIRQVYAITYLVLTGLLILVQPKRLIGLAHLVAYTWNEVRGRNHEVVAATSGRASDPAGGKQHQ